MNRLDADHWTYADYLRLPDDGTRCEILDGERVMTPSPLTRHQIVSMRLAWHLVSFVQERSLGVVLCAPCDVILADDVVVQPDILFVAKSRQSLIKRRGIFGPPDLAIEILSESDPSRDTVRKLAIYGRRGIPEYWIVDPDADRIEIFVLEGGRVARKSEHASGEVGSLVALPGFVAPLSAIFSRSL